MTSISRVNLLTMLVSPFGFVCIVSSILLGLVVFRLGIYRPKNERQVSGSTIIAVTLAGLITIIISVLAGMFCFGGWSNQTMVFWMIFLSVMGLNVAVLLITFAYSSVAKFSPIEKPALIPVEVIGLIVVFLILSGFSFGISTALTAIFALLF